MNNIDKKTEDINNILNIIEKSVKTFEWSNIEENPIEKTKEAFEILTGMSYVDGMGRIFIKYYNEANDTANLNSSIEHMSEVEIIINIDCAIEYIRNREKIHGSIPAKFKEVIEKTIKDASNRDIINQSNAPKRPAFYMEDFYLIPKNDKVLERENRFFTLTGIPYSHEAVKLYIDEIFEQDFRQKFDELRLQEHADKTKQPLALERIKFGEIYQQELQKLGKTGTSKYLENIFNAKEDPSEEREAFRG